MLGYNEIPFKNRLLLQLSDNDQFNLRSVMHRQILVQNQILHEFDTLLSDVYFIDEGMAATVCRTEADRYVQVSAIGNEGVVGALVLLGSSSPFDHRIFMQMPGYGWRISASDFRRICERMPDLCKACARYLHVAFIQALRSTACNTSHGLEARFAKWILMTDDRAQDGVLSLTHQTMAIMLGAHRTRVTAMARKFQDTGSIRYSRGRLMVQDRAKLKAIACTAMVRIRTFWPIRLIPEIICRQ